MRECRLAVMRFLPSAMAVLALFFGGAASASASTDSHRLKHAFIQDLVRRAELTRPPSGPRFLAALAMSGHGERSDRAADIPPGLAFLMSAALPGTGQLVEGRNRAFTYLGIEAISWVAHFSWQDAGNNKEKEYQAYARQHWSLDTYDANAGPNRPDSCSGSIPAGLSYDDSRNTLEGFIAEGNWQHYYEDIGKLEAYRAGWDDFDCAEPNQMSPNRTEYRSMRAKSNDYLNHARAALTVAFLNRVISAVDAYRTARGARLRLHGADVKLSVGGSLARPRATLKLVKTF